MSPTPGPSSPPSPRSSTAPASAPSSPAPPSAIPVALAKAVTTVDHASNGRVILGIGAGWHLPEHHAYDIPFPGNAERIRRLEETIRVIRLLWTEDRANFDGRYYKLRNAPFQPKPLQKPHPPILVGGAGEQLTLPMVARVADDWNWNITGTPTTIDASSKSSTNAAKRPDATPPKSPSPSTWTSSSAMTPTASPPPSASTPRPMARPSLKFKKKTLVGNPDEVRQRLQAFIDLGVTTFMFSLRAPFDEAGTQALPDIRQRALRYHTTMDDVRRMAHEVLPPLRKNPCITVIPTPSPLQNHNPGVPRAETSSPLTGED